MNPWIIIISVSVILGVGIGAKFSGKKGIVLAGLVPWLALLFLILFQEYVLPYQGGGASMWPIAQIIGGTAVAITGIVSYLVYKKFQSNKI